jgi:hypothetical protein
LRIAPRDRPTRPKFISSGAFRATLHIDTELLTALIDIVFALLHLRLKRPVENARFLWNCSIALGQDGKLVPGYLELSYRLPNDLLVYAAGIDVGGIPG